MTQDGLRREQDICRLDQCYNSLVFRFLTAKPCFGQMTVRVKIFVFEDLTVLMRFI